MTIPGPTAHRQLMDGYKSLQLRLEAMRSRSTTIDTEKGDLGQDRSRALLDLAEYYLPDLTRESIESSWHETRSDMQEVLLRKEDHRRRLSETFDAANQKRQRLEERLLQIGDSLDQAKSRQAELALSVETELAADETFVDLSHKAAVAEAALERAEANLNEIEQDATRKLPGYESSTLFNYLKDRQFGTADYKNRGFTRRMDRWLAKYIDYSKAKQGYDFLADTPDHMRKIIADDRDAFDTVMKELENRRDLVVDRIGLSAAIDKVNQLSDQRERQLIELDEAREVTESLDRELTDLEDSRGEYYREAVSLFREMLSHMHADDLASKAKRTPSLTDDQIVARIQGVDQRIDDLDDEMRRNRDGIRDLQRCIEALGRLMQKFRASKFDAARSTFMPSLDIIDIINRANNERDIDDAWDRIRGAQRWGPSLGDQLGHVASHPLTQIMIGAMAQAAGSAMRSHADRAGRRRYHSSLSDWSGDSSDYHKKRKKKRR